MSHEPTLLHSPTSKVNPNPLSPLFSGRNEIDHPDLWRRDQRTWREGRSTHRIPIRVWTGDVRTQSERFSEIWTYYSDWEKSLNEWKETEKRDWETAESEFSVEGGEVGSD